MLLHFILFLCLLFTASVSLSLSLSLSLIVNCFVYIIYYIYSIYLSSKQHALHFAICLSYIPNIHSLTPINYIYISLIFQSILSLYIFMICGMAVPHNSHSPYTYINHILYIFLISVSICFVCISLCLSFALLFFYFVFLLLFLLFCPKRSKRKLNPPTTRSSVHPTRRL